MLCYLPLTSFLVIHTFRVSPRGSGLSPSLNKSQRPLLKYLLLNDLISCDGFSCWLCLCCGKYTRIESPIMFSTESAVIKFCLLTVQRTISWVAYIHHLQCTRCYLGWSISVCKAPDHLTQHHNSVKCKNTHNRLNWYCCALFELEQEIYFWLPVAVIFC